MTSSDTQVLSYRGFVERWCQETDGGVFSSGPSAPDVRKAAHKLGLPRPRSSTGSCRPANPEYRRWTDDWFRLVRSRAEIFGDWHHYHTCRWCDAQLESCNDGDPSGRFDRVERRNCPQCGWWDTDAYLPPEQEDGSNYIRSIHRRAVLREFAVSSGSVPTADLAQHIARYPASIFHVEPYKMEELVADIFTRTMDCTVQWLGGPGDGGIDLLLVQGDETYAVQVKRKSKIDSPIRVSLVREFVGAMVIEGVAKGIFVTTSSFTKQAERASIRAAHRPSIEKVDLLDGSQLVELCRLAYRSNSAHASAELYEEPLFSHHLRDGFHEFNEMAFHPTSKRI
jgi:hypothetical protein